MDTTEKINLNKCIAFLENIGITTKYESFTEDGLLPGLKIENGTILIDIDKLLYPGDILHEAGHIAVVPANERQTLSNETIDSRKDNAAEEMMAIAWSFAACLHLQLDTSFVFHENGYKGSASHIAENFKQGHYFGVPMLQWVGMALERKKEDTPDLPVYPAMLKWMRD